MVYTIVADHQGFLLVQFFTQRGRRDGARNTHDEWTCSKQVDRPVKAQPHRDHYLTEISDCKLKVCTDISYSGAPNAGIPVRRPSDNCVSQFSTVLPGIFRGYNLKMKLLPSFTFFLKISTGYGQEGRNFGVRVPEGDVFLSSSRRADQIWDSSKGYRDRFLRTGSDSSDKLTAHITLEPVAIIR